MRKRLTAFIFALFLGAVPLLSGCTTPIDYDSMPKPEYTTEDPADNKEIEQETVIIPDAVSADTHKPGNFVLSPEEYSESYQLEFNSDAEAHTEGLSGYNGTGFICLANKEYATLTVTVPSSQHYKIGVRICTAGTKVAIITGGDKETDSADGSYKTIDGTVWGAVYAGESMDFTYFYLDGVYLGKGENRLTLQVLSGTAYIDDITIENSSTVSDLAFEVSNGCINKNANDSAKAVKRYLADVYGNRVLTGQYCTSGTNTEMNAIYMETGRYPAIRCADIGIFTEYYEGPDKNSEDELDMAAQWWKSGGIVSYSWYWYAPTEENSHYNISITDFNLKNAVTDNDIALLNPASLEAYRQTGRISEECLKLINDIDSVASKLKLLEAQGVPVLFRPLPEAGNGWYWWGRDKDSYLWLYKLIYRRMTEYHELNGLIWIWNGESADFYPGDDLVDIVGMDMYSDSDISGNSRMLDAIRYTIRTKPTALTECGRIPNPDYVARDNAKWLWFALWKGDYIINSDGTISYAQVSSEELDYAYNNELYITKDELPDFARY